MKKTIWIISIVLIIGIVGYFVWANFFNHKKNNHHSINTPNPAQMAVKPEGYIVGTKDISDYLKISGTLIPNEETEIRAEVSGRITKLYLPEGANVAQGTLLIKIFDGDLQAQLKKLENQLLIAQNTEQRQSSLLKINGISQQEYDLSLLQVQNLKAEIEIIKVNIQKTEIYAPFSGVIGLKNISNGAYITPNTIITTLRQITPLKLDFSVPEKYGTELRAGQKINFTLADEKKEYEATILANDQKISPNSRNLMIRAVVNNQDDKLMAGAFAEVFFDTKPRQKSIVVPSQAIIPQARNKQIIVSKQGKASFVNVKTGARQAEFVEVLEGIQVGDTIATTGVLFIRPDMPLKFTKIVTPQPPKAE